MKLDHYVRTHARRGACLCGLCFDGPENPEEAQPTGHTIDLTFFKVAKNEDDPGSKEEFLGLVQEEYPHWLNGEEYTYLTMGGDMGDPGIALMTIGYGDLLGAWKARSPDTELPFLPSELKQHMAGSGMVTAQFSA